MLTTQLDRLDRIADIPVLDETGNDIQPSDLNIEFRNVDFSYDSRPVLKDISLTIPQGTTCAIVRNNAFTCEGATFIFSHSLIRYG